MDKKQISVLIADDTIIAVEGLKTILGTAPDIRVIGDTHSVYLVPRMVEEIRPDILIIDLRWAEDQSIGWITIRKLKEEHPELKILAVTAYPELLPDARRAGADAALSKSFDREGLLAVLRDLASRPASSLLALGSEATGPQLTRRELEVLELIARGMTDKEISLQLEIETSTVKTHVGSIMSKLGASNRQKAALRARELKLIR